MKSKAISDNQKIKSNIDGEENQPSYWSSNLVAFFVFVFGFVLMIKSVSIVNHNSGIMRDATAAIKTIQGFTYQPSKDINNKLVDVVGIADDVVDAIWSTPTNIKESLGLLMDLPGFASPINKIKEIHDDHLVKIVQSIKVYKRIDRGQYTASEYPEFESKFEALLDDAEADLILESKSLFEFDK